MDVSALVRMLAIRVGLQTDAVDGSGLLNLTVDGDLALTVEPIAGERGACFLAELGALPERNASAALKRLLQHNLEHRGNSGSFLSLDGRQDLLVLCRRVTTDEYLTFEAEFEGFVDEAVQLRRSFGSAGSTQEAPTSPDSGWAFLGIRA